MSDKKVEVLPGVKISDHDELELRYAVALLEGIYDAVVFGKVLDSKSLPLTKEEIKAGIVNDLRIRRDKKLEKAKKDDKK